ncbi:MAG: hypothetical protein JKX97_05830 [Candidatus Lindowbacteria bacterium]|nr:hypothetical protein [Candidatus Lindowbacteria bacterium]
MENRFRSAWIVAIVVLAVAVVGVQAATVITPQGDGLRFLTLTATNGTNDTGVGFYSLGNSGSDSVVDVGVFFAHVPTTGKISAHDTVLATKNTNSGSPKVLTGKVTVGSSSSVKLTIQSSDTAQTVVSSVSVTDSNVFSQGSWSGTLSGQSGVSHDTRLWPGGSTDGEDTASDLTINFADSISAQSLSRILGDSAQPSFSIVTTDTITIFDSGASTGQIDTSWDTARLIVFDASGNLDVDLQMTAVTASQNHAGFTGGNATVTLETGVNTITVIFWDADSRAYQVLSKKVAIGVGSAFQNLDADSQASLVSNIGSAFSNNTISQIEVNAGPLLDIGQIQILNPDQDTGAKSDNYAEYDSATSGFDTRLSGTVFEINLLDQAGNAVTALQNSQTLLVSINHSFANYSSSNASATKLLHLNSNNQWEVVSNSTSDSANGRVTAFVSEFSIFALGLVSSTVTTVADDDDCLIDNTIGGTSLGSIMPSLRSTRDSIMTSSLGRLLVSGYYSFAALALLFAAGTGLAYAGARKQS